MKIIGIAGGSGAGKSTISYALEDDDPDSIEVLNIDDYQKRPNTENLPMIDGVINWDHPDIILWDELIHDLTSLRGGKSIKLDVWAHRSNPDYSVHRQLQSRTINPKQILIVEGYLALHSAAVRAFFDTSFYLDVTPEIRSKRRGKNNVIGSDDYEKNVLIPMHEMYVEPSKKYADVILDVSLLSISTVCQLIKDQIDIS